MKMNEISSAFTKLSNSARAKGMEIVLPCFRKGKAKNLMLRIELRQDGKIIDYEMVKLTESVDAASKRIHARLRKEKLLDV